MGILGVWYVLFINFLPPVVVVLLFVFLIIALWRFFRR